VWKVYEIEWLRSLAVPLYLARVNSDCSRVDFYSLWPVWPVLGGGPWPFRIVCEFNDPSSSPFVLEGATRESDGSHGDRITSTVHLGLLSVTQKDLSDPSFKEHAAALMGIWVGYDRLTVIRLLLRVAYFQGIRQWSTNDFDLSRKLILKGWMAYSSIPGQNIDDICKTFEPVITNLGWHLQHQDDLAAYNLIPALEWLQSSGRLVGFGRRFAERTEGDESPRKVSLQRHRQTKLIFRADRMTNALLIEYQTFRTARACRKTA